MKHFLSILILFLCALTASAQKLDVSVVSFELDPFSTAAQRGSQYAATDGNGDLYSIIKVKDADGQAVPDGFMFDFGVVRTLKVEAQPNGEQWVWVQRNAKQVSIYHQNYRTIEKYDLGTTIEAGRVYDMVLTLARVDMIVRHDVGKQILQFEVSPADEGAVVSVKRSDATQYDLWGQVDATGHKSQLLDFGVYDYSVSAKGYQTSVGRVKLDNAKEKHVERITLSPNYGWLEVSDDHGISGAEIYIDNQLLGTVPYSNPQHRMEPGTYHLSVLNGEFYKPFYADITIEAGQTTRLSPRLESNYAETTLTVDADADIYIDGQLKGRRTWQGPLKAGRYTVECRRENYYSSSAVVNVKADLSETFTLPAPLPRTGTLYVNTEPAGATITLDGQPVGTTPAQIADLIVGEHRVVLSLPNSQGEERTVSIEEGKLQSLEVELKGYAPVQFESNPSHARIYINGVNKGFTPYSDTFASGNYNVRLVKDNYRTLRQTVHLDGSTPGFVFTLQRCLQRKTSFYVQPTLQAGSLMAAGATLGGYLQNVNIEAGYLYGLSSTDAYWTTVDATGIASQQETLRPSVVGARLGYGIILGSRLRLTPQLGGSLTSLSGSISKSHAISATAGLRADCVVVNHLGVSLTPSYGMSVKQSDTFRRLVDAGVGVKGWASGFNVSLGIYFYL